MANLVTEYLEETVEKYPDKEAFIDVEHEMTFKELRDGAFKIASCLIRYGHFKKPILIKKKKNIYCIMSFVGVAYSGNFYSPIDIKMPIARIEKVIDTLNPIYLQCRQF